MRSTSASSNSPFASTRTVDVAPAKTISRIFPRSEFSVRVLVRAELNVLGSDREKDGFVQWRELIVFDCQTEACARLPAS